MLEACIDRRTGEIIVVKPKGSPWSGVERDGPVLAVVELNDPALKLKSTIKAYPYEVRGIDYDDPELGEVTLAMSRWKIDRRGLSPGIKCRVKDLKADLTEYSPRDDLWDCR